MQRKLNFAVFIIIMTFFSCGKMQKDKSEEMTSKMKVDIEVLIQDSTLNVRALEINKKEGTGVFATSDGRYGALDAINNEISIKNRINYDTLVPNFRSVAQTSSGMFLLSIASPAMLFKVTMDLDSMVYVESDKKTFYDSIEFWNDREGIAAGDPTEDCMSIIITRDGGNTWNKLSCDNLPRAIEGEAAFAASDTNIAIVDEHTWVATGGMASRILYSADKGKTWEIFETPIVQGKPTSGMYSLDFYDKYNGFAIGGDYTKPTDSSANKIRTQDGGKTWKLIAENQSPGYRSCVRYLPNSKAKKLVAVGFKGIDYSADVGDTWQHLSDESFYTVRFLNDSVAFAGGNGRVAKLKFSQE